MRYRVKLVPSPEGGVSAVVQVRFLGLFWRDQSLFSNRLHRKQWELLKTYRKLHDLAKEVENEQHELNMKIEEAKIYGDRLKAIGPEWSDDLPPIFIKTERAVVGPSKKDLEAVTKAIKEGNMTHPDDLGIEWPPRDSPVATPGKTRTAYLLAKHWVSGALEGIVKEGETYDHVVKYHKPKEEQQSKSQRKRQNQQQQQGNN